MLKNSINPNNQQISQINDNNCKDICLIPILWILGNLTNGEENIYVKKQFSNQQHVKKKLALFIVQAIVQQKNDKEVYGS